MNIMLVQRMRYASAVENGNLIFAIGFEFEPLVAGTKASMTFRSRFEDSPSRPICFGREF